MTSSVVAPIRSNAARVSCAESIVGSKSTVDTERRVTGFPAGFGGWTAAKMYERSMKGNKHAVSETDNAAASAARQEVRPCFNYL